MLESSESITEFSAKLKKDSRKIHKFFEIKRGKNRVLTNQNFFFQFQNHCKSYTVFGPLSEKLGLDLENKLASKRPEILYLSV
jgi:hypothetical protein